MYCQELVKANLKAPASAEFEGWTFPKRVDAQNQVYVYDSHVDAQNSFGAKLRTNFHCKVKCTAIDKCESLEFQME